MEIIVHFRELYKIYLDWIKNKPKDDTMSTGGTWKHQDFYRLHLDIAHKQPKTTNAQAQTCERLPASWLGGELTTLVKV